MTMRIQYGQLKINMAATANKLACLGLNMLEKVMKYV